MSLVGALVGAENLQPLRIFIQDFRHNVLFSWIDFYYLFFSSVTVLSYVTMPIYTD